MLIETAVAHYRRRYTTAGFRELTLYPNIGVAKSRQLQSLLETRVIDRKALMIGDRAVDLAAATKNNLAAAGVLWGYGSRDELMSEIPHFLFTTPREIGDTFARLIQA